MTEPHAPLREVRRWMRVSTPVNKAASSGLRGRLPQIAGPLMIGALGVGTQRFTDLVSSALEAAFPETFIDHAATSGSRAPVEGAPGAPRRVVNVEVGEGFGRPSLVSIDVVVSAADELAHVEAATRALDVATRVTWNNDDIVPVSVRARVLLAHDDASDLEAPGAQSNTVVDMSALGFADEIARPDELYDRYGAPEGDPAWRP